MIFLVLGLNYAPERIGIAVYTTGMAEALADLGHEVDVIAGQPYYPAWKVFDPALEVWVSKGVERGVFVRRVGHYVPARPTGMKRLIHHASFGLSALFPTLGRAIARKPDLVIAVAPSLVAAPVAWLAARLSGARCWLHIQDFEVEAAFATRLLTPDRWAGRMALALERSVLGLFDTVSAISPQMCQRLAKKGVKSERIVEFRNWTDIDRIVPATAPSPYRAEWGISTPHVALYSGNIGNKQGLELVVEAARMLAHRRDLTVVICGEGANRGELERLAAGLDNVRFRDLQPVERLAELMALATIHLLPQLKSVGDLVLPSKLINMLASGRPIVAAAERGTGLWDEVEGCGFTVPPGDTRAFAKAIERLMDDPDLARSSGVNARRRAERRWGRAQVLGDFFAHVAPVSPTKDETDAR